MRKCIWKINRQFSIALKFQFDIIGADIRFWIKESLSLSLIFLVKTVWVWAELQKFELKGYCFVLSSNFLLRSVVSKAVSSSIVVRTAVHFTETRENISLLSPKEPCTSKATDWTMYPVSINSWYFCFLRAPASVAVVPGLHKEPWLRRLGAKSSQLWHPTPAFYPFPKEHWCYHLGVCKQFGTVHTARALRTFREISTSPRW